MQLLSLIIPLLLSSFTTAYLKSVLATQNCYPVLNVIGKTQMCPCSGALNPKGTPQGLIGDWCKDLNYNPLCPSTHVFQPGDQKPGKFPSTTGKKLIATGGLCSTTKTPIPNCKWSSMSFSWNCCACPPGYAPMGTRSCNSGSYCAICTEKGEKLVDNGSGTLKCVKS